jgi:hypothetical protein
MRPILVLDAAKRVRISDVFEKAETVAGEVDGLIGANGSKRSSLAAWIGEGQFGTCAGIGLGARRI